MEPKKIVAPFLRSPYNYDTNAAGDESGLRCDDKTLAQQQFADEADINTIVKRFNLTGQLPTNVRMPSYEDYEGVFDFHTAQTAIAQANQAFAQMPAHIRSRFHNDPAEFVDFCANDENRPEAEKMGLVRPRELAAQAAELAKLSPLQATAPKAQGGPEGAGSK